MDCGNNLNDRKRIVGTRKTLEVASNADKTQKSRFHWCPMTEPEEFRKRMFMRKEAVGEKKR
jgi:hypothetical protein